MSKAPQNLSETHIIGARTKQWIVRAENCPALRLHQIAHVGIADAAVPYSMVRTHLRGTYMLACFSGAGRILLDGRWQLCRAGMACLAPPHVLHAFHAVDNSRWGFCWVRYEQPPEQQPIIATASPVLTRFDGRPLQSAILGLYHEVNGAAEPGVVHHWVEIIQGYVIRFAQPWHVDDRLWRLWLAVERNLSAPWTLEKLCASSHFSAEHLRRLCRRQLGRSPMHHVTYLRMQRAAVLLESTNDKIESIASALGYENPFVFSNTFKKWIGWRPSEYRRRGEIKNPAAG
ncbi:MAG TPA: AraC family transcriptional regulator [Candidatus Angelobacter sp.]|nr:AraC family transcriptional regulator [Candidatus Angelobacter sp.]